MLELGRGAVSSLSSRRASVQTLNKTLTVYILSFVLVKYLIGSTSLDWATQNTVQFSATRLDQDLLSLDP